MKMPNDDFLEPLRKRPDNKPSKQLEDSLHSKMFDEVKRRRSMASWKFRFGMVAVLLLLILINPLELFMSKNGGQKSGIDKVEESQMIVDEDNNKTNTDNNTDSNKDSDTQEDRVYDQALIEEIITEHPTFKRFYESLNEFGISNEIVSAFIFYQYGLLMDDAKMVIDHGLFSDNEQEELAAKMVHYYKENVDFSSSIITNIEISQAEPDYLITVHYNSFDGSLMEVEYVLSLTYSGPNNYSVYDPIKKQNNIRK